MALLILAGDVLSIPAAGEHQLEADAVSAVGIKVGLVWEEVAVERTFGGLGVVETVESDGGGKVVQHTRRSRETSRRRGRGR